MKPAIIVVGYNRPNSLKRILNSINKAHYKTEDITLIISLDKANNEEEVVKVAENFFWKHGQKIIRRFSERQGLRNHILQCGDLSNKYGSVIIIEDDLLVSPDYYEYTSSALQFYENEECVTGIALYSHEWNGYARKNFVPIADEFDTYLGQYSITWGQCWTKKWWNQFKTWYLTHEDKLSNNSSIPININNWSEKSWGKYFVYYIVESNKYYVIPRISRSTNFSDIGEHVRITDNVHQVRLMTGAVKQYNFAPTDKAQKYDIYFENLRVQDFFPKYKEDGITIDLGGYGRNSGKNRYILSTLCLPYKIINSYGLQLRPYEMNIINEVPGNSIFLYDTAISSKVYKKRKNDVMRYEIRGFSVRDLLPYVCFLIRTSINNKLRNRGR